MVLKLYATADTSNSKRVATVLLEKQVPFELINVDVYQGEQKRPEYLEKQPFGQIPCMDDDGFILFESRAICRYIATKYADQGTKLIPTEAKEIALFEQAASIEATNFEPFAGTISFERIIKPRYGAVPDENRVSESLKKLDAKLDAYEVILGKQKYLAGDEITLADLFHLPQGAQLAKPEIGSDILQTRPNVARWWANISSRPSWTSVAEGIKSGAA